MNDNQKIDILTSARALYEAALISLHTRNESEFCFNRLEYSIKQMQESLNKLESE
jgi:hypothetical protein